MKSELDRGLDAWYFQFLSALVYALATQQTKKAGFRERNLWVLRMSDSQQSMPDFLVWPVRLGSLLLDCSTLLLTGKCFHALHAPSRVRFLESWRNSWKPFRELMRFYDSLFIICISNNGKRTSSTSFKKVRHILTRFHKNLVVGSGPGGAITAEMLIDCGEEVLLLEQGRQWNEKDLQEYSYEEMRYKYRSAGLTPTFGKQKIAYVEGCCVGGGSEINSGLYHRTPECVLDYWASNYGLMEADSKTMESHFTWSEKKFHVSMNPGKLPLASLKLEEGAKNLGWKAAEVPRWYDYRNAKGNSGIKQTMSRNCIKNFIEKGGILKDECRVLKVKKAERGWKVTICNADHVNEIETERLILSGGALSTPLLLRKSGLSKLAGHSLQMHPTVKVTARFEKEVNEEQMLVPSHQVSEFAPYCRFGCSISSKSYLKLSMLDHPDHQEKIEGHWKKMSIYYAMIVPKGQGSVRVLPSAKDPLVRFSVTQWDSKLLSTGLKNLCRLLFSAGAAELYPSIPGMSPLQEEEDLNRIPNVLPDSSSLMSVHLFSSCPMGEIRERTVTDSFGKVHDQKGLWVADASLLPSAPGVNPQGSLMAFVHRNILKMLEER